MRRGLVFTGGESPSVEFCKKLTGICMTEANVIVAADSGLQTLFRAGISADWIIGDMDSLEDKSLLEKYPSEKIIAYPPDKDFTDTELALQFLFEKKCDDVWLIGGGGGRLDHLLAIRSLFERKQIPSRWYTKNEIIIIVENKMETFDIDTNGIVSVFPLGSGPWDIESTGLKWKLDGLKWERGFFGISNVALESTFSLNAKAGRFMIIIPAKADRQYK